MNTKLITRKEFKVAEAFPDGKWYTEVDRFHGLAHLHLKRLKQFAAQVSDAWPVAPNLKLNAELIALAGERDAASDIARMFAAMAIEAFLNYYGAVRLGEDEYKAHFERLGIVPKTRQLLLICDAKNVSESDPLIQALKDVFDGRNSLVHPKAKKASASDSPLKHGLPIPETAQNAVDAMDRFFREFLSLVPDSIYFINVLRRN